MLVSHDPMCHEVSRACNRLRNNRVEIGKVDTIQVRDGLLTVQNVKIKARPWSETVQSSKRFQSA
jgi:hypothetical protein